MTYLPWVLAIIILGMLAYPILQIVPSKQQKLRIKLRQVAAIKGLRVQIRKPTLPGAIQDTHRELHNAVAYHLPAFNDHLSRHLSIRSLGENKEWFWPDQNRPQTKYLEPLLEQYSKLPSFILAVEHTPAGHSIFWHEQGDEQTINEIHQILKSFEQLFTAL